MKNLYGIVQIGTQRAVNGIKDGFLYMTGKYKETKEIERQKAENRELCESILKDYDSLINDKSSNTRIDDDILFESHY